MRRMLTPVVLTVALLLVGCGASGGEGAESTDVTVRPTSPATTSSSEARITTTTFASEVVSLAPEVLDRIKQAIDETEQTVEVCAKDQADFTCQTGLHLGLMRTAFDLETLAGEINSAEPTLPAELETTVSAIDRVVEVRDQILACDLKQPDCQALLSDLVNRIIDVGFTSPAWKRVTQ